MEWAEKCSCLNFLVCGEVYYKKHSDLFVSANDTTLNDYVVTFNAGQSVSFVQACDDMSGSPYKATRHSLLVTSGMSWAFGVVVVLFGVC